MPRSVGRFFRSASLCWLLTVAACRAGAGDRVFVIGTDNTRPYHYLDERGQPAGMTGVVVAEAARRAGIRLTWRVHQEGAPQTVLASHQVDLWPLLSVQPEFRGRLHYTRPYFSNSYVLLAADQQYVTLEQARRAHRIALMAFPLVMQLARRTFPNSEFVNRKSREDALSAVCRGEADEVFVEARTAQYLSLERPPGCEGTHLYANGLDLPPRRLSIASTFEASGAADRLRLEIDRMISDGTMSRLLRPWNYFYSGEADTLFQMEQSQAANRLSLMLAGGLAVVSGLLLFLLARVRRAQQVAIAADSAKSLFVANMSHEIRTPMNGVIGMLNLARNTHSEAECQEYIRYAQSSADSLLSLLNDVLDFSKIEAGRVEIRTGPFKLVEPVREACTNIRPKATEKGLRLGCRIGDDVPLWAEGDQGRIRQVLLNLLSNAVKFTDEGSIAVEIDAKAIDEGRVEICFSVTDTGIGVPEAERETIFEVFRQADGSMSRKYGGTGLGLTISRKLAELMGGSLSVESQPGQGSTFHFRVPLVPITAPARPLGGSLAEPAASKRSLNLLLAEDHPINQKLALTHLKRRGHRVVLAANGREALEKAGQGNFDAILMDVQMPEMDGFEATRRIRETERTTGKHVRIVAMTAHAMAEDRDRCLAAGMDDYVAKPFKPEELYKVVEQG